ncbi:MAG: hypothetical protein SGPRY_012311, partial [Prymnesium sp.]
DRYSLAPRSTPLRYHSMNQLENSRTKKAAVVAEMAVAQAAVEMQVALKESLDESTAPILDAPPRHLTAKI